MYDVIIIGGGPAAISAGIYLARKKVRLLIVSKEWGGQAVKTSMIENYPGFEIISGPDLIKKFVSQLKGYQSVIPVFPVIPAKAGIQNKKLDSRVKPENDILHILENTEAKEIKLNNNIIKIKINNNFYKSKALIIATGGISKKLNVPGEKEFMGKGVAYCSICDAPFFKNKEVAIIGGGNAGLEAALDLDKYAKKIYILEFMPELSGDKVLQDRIKNNKKIKIITNALVKEIKGDKFVNKLIYQDKKLNKNKELLIQGVFIQIGWNANSSLVKNMLELNSKGEIKINSRNFTSKQNILAAGDVTDISHKQIAIAVGEGVKAALNVHIYLNK